jgi:isopenicillin N synthase-like dioxygenase
MTQPIPIIDITALRNGAHAGERAVSREIGAACRGIGFFYITGHGIAPETLANVFRTAQQFFTSPTSAKGQARFSGPADNRGYIKLGGESLDPTKPPDVKEAFNIGLELAPDDPDLTAKKPFRALNRWPDVPQFRATMLDYFDRAWFLGVTLHRAFALDLGLDAAFFADKFRKPMATLRLLHYPPTQQPLSAGQLGAGIHTDYGNVTLLATDAAGGLMVRDRSGQWLDAPVVGAFVCNIGDCLMRWTNDVYVSTRTRWSRRPGATATPSRSSSILTPMPRLRACRPAPTARDRPSTHP